MGDLILAEALPGFRSEEEFEQACLALARFTQVSLVNPAPAERSVQNYRSLRSQGVTVRKTIDCLIATYCLENDYSVLESRPHARCSHPEYGCSHPEYGCSQ